MSTASLWDKVQAARLVLAGLGIGTDVIDLADDIESVLDSETDPSEAWDDDDARAAFEALTGDGHRLVQVDHHISEAMAETWYDTIREALVEKGLLE